MEKTEAGEYRSFLFLKMCLNWLTDAVEGMDAADDDDVDDI